jgi:hypothetical protein
MGEVVCTQNIFKRKGAKPILQATAIDKNAIFEMISIVALSVLQLLAKSASSPFT